MTSREQLRLAADIEEALETLETAAAHLNGKPNKLQFDGDEEDDDTEFDFGDESIDVSTGEAIVDLSPETKSLLLQCINSRISDLRSTLKSMGIDD